MKRTRVAIIGNSLPLRDSSKEIDSADIVVRFSKMEHLHSGLIGTKTDIIVINPNKHFLDSVNIVGDDDRKGAYKNAGIFFRGNDTSLIETIIHKFGITNKTTVINPDLIARKVREIFAWNGEGNMNISTGVLTTCDFIFNRPDCDLELYNFRYDGDMGPFKFDTEAELIHLLESKKLLKLIV